MDGYNLCALQTSLVSVPIKKVGLETYTIQRQTLSHDGSLLFTTEANTTWKHM